MYFFYYLLKECMSILISEKDIDLPKQINILIECGSGNVLSNLAKRQAQPIASYPTDKPARLEKLLEVLS